MPAQPYLYVLHTNKSGHETTARSFASRELALITLGAEIGEALRFVETGRRSGSHTLKRFVNQGGRPGEMLEAFLADQVSVR